MHKQPDFHSLDFFSDANFWTQGDASTRRVFIMPLAEPSEFLGFGVLAPSNEVLFVARGHVLDHLGDFIVRMEQAGALVELYARPPLPDAIVNEYIGGKPHEQKETEPPPPPPTFNAQEDQIIFKGDSTQYSLSEVSNLWPFGGSSKVAWVLPVPDSTSRLVFGLHEVNNSSYFWGVSFVGRVGTSSSDLIDQLIADGITVENYSDPECRSLVDYWALYFSGSLKKAA
ncbi:MAG: hypothetical protein JXB05_23680 [Myxococcaceae bacterium]|nr:hypothetical protein [Myxococcaceae bacterium]